MAIKMKATRAAVRTARNLEEVATQVAAIQEQLNRIEDMLATFQLEPVIERETVANEPPVTKAPAKPAPKAKGK